MLKSNFAEAATQAQAICKICGPVSLPHKCPGLGGTPAKKDKPPKKPAPGTSCKLPLAMGLSVV